MPDEMGDLAAPSDPLIPPPYRAPGQDSTAAKIGAAILTGPLRAAMYPGKVWRGEANPYEGDEATDWATGTALGMIARGASSTPAGALGTGGGRIVQPTPMGEIAAPQGIRAYHSSQHDFDRFDISKIGTGEGAQVYGHGLYFAENPAVSGQGGQYWQQFLQRLDPNTPEFNAANRLKAAGWDRDKAIAAAKQDVADWNDMLSSGSKDPYFNKMRDMRNKEIELLSSGKPVGPRTYEVNIAAKPEQFLDWDKPLSAQPQVAERLYDAGFSVPRSISDLSYLEQMARQHGPDSWYALQLNAVRGTANKPGSDFVPRTTEMAATMREAGIPGIKYLDQGSRGPVDPVYDLKDPGQLAAYAKQLYSDNAVRSLNAWGGPEADAARRLLMSGQPLPALKDIAIRPPPTSNYVVFNDKLIDILRKYGFAGMAPPVLGALAAPDQRE
jgi:hypothetical protein